LTSKKTIQGNGGQGSGVRTCGDGWELLSWAVHVCHISHTRGFCILNRLLFGGSHFGALITYGSVVRGQQQKSQLHCSRFVSISTCKTRASFMENSHIYVCTFSIPTA